MGETNLVVEEMQECCPICLESLKADVRHLECEHAFHTECIGTWLTDHVSCPVCRVTVQGASSAGASAANLTDESDSAQEHEPYFYVCSVLTVIWVLLGNPLMMLWSLCTVGAHTRCTMVFHILLGFLVYTEVDDVSRLVGTPPKIAATDLTLALQIVAWVRLQPQAVEAVRSA